MLLIEINYCLISSGYIWGCPKSKFSYTKLKHYLEDSKIHFKIHVFFETIVGALYK
jgi:hypothetical protein